VRKDASVAVLEAELAAVIAEVIARDAGITNAADIGERREAQWRRVLLDQYQAQPSGWVRTMVRHRRLAAHTRRLDATAGSAQQPLPKPRRLVRAKDYRTASIAALMAEEWAPPRLPTGSAQEAAEIERTPGYRPGHLATPPAGIVLQPAQDDTPGTRAQ
jgi:hypothetical protein